ncbi:ABC transporter permease [Kaistia adipata]|uniref:ABC transporter permease n=1 Tax=Kaistia adipata TaxID=166954 RepID=UPI00048E0A05|nr:ABC transporter permease [Kaistia adipata]
MRIELVRRGERSAAMAYLSPLLALLLTLIGGALIVVVWRVVAADLSSPDSGGLAGALGKGCSDYGKFLYVFFIEPLTAMWSLEDLVAKATPIILVAIGLSLCYLSNTWNIGAEGQIAVGAIAGSFLPIFFPEAQGPFILPAMLILGMLGGMAYAAIPALLKIRFGTNEILTSLMLVYVAQLFLDWLARGPWRNPAGHNFPDSRPFDGDQLLPTLFGTNIRISILFVLVAAFAAWFLMRWTRTGFQIRVLGQAPRAGAFAGFSQNKMVLLTFLISGALAGLAGISEVAGPIGQLRTTVSPGYGFTAIIVAFLGRLNPIGAIFAGFLLALSYLGGEGAQIALGMSDQTTRVFQGMLLFFVLACDSFIFYRLQIVRRPVTQTQAVAS